MKVQCPSCREIVDMKDFSTSAQGLSFECPGCHASNFLANPGAQDSTAPRAPTPEEQGKQACPKCGHIQEDTYACHRCGLVFSKLDLEKLPAPPEEATALWAEIENNLDDEKLHDNFLNSCLQVNRLDYAVKQYRLLSHRPGYEDLGKKMLALVSVKGQAQLPVDLLTQRLRGKSKKGAKIIAWILVAIVVGFGMYYGWAVVKMVLSEGASVP